MATIKEDYVSFEIAKLLKEKGFDSKCSKVWIYSKSINPDINAQLMCAQYFMEGESLIDNDDIDIVLSVKEVYGNAYLAPTFQMAMKWLREVHKLYINVCPCVEGYYWTEKWHSYVENLKKRYPFGRFICTFNSCEQATEAAIKYCLENII